MNQVSLSVTGMDCSACEARVERALAGIAGVARARADRLKEKVQVAYDPAHLTEEQIRTAIQAAGFQVNSTP